MFFESEEPLDIVKLYYDLMPWELLLRSACIHCGKLYYVNGGVCDDCGL